MPHVVRSTPTWQSLKTSSSFKALNWNVLILLGETHHFLQENPSFSDGGSQNFTVVPSTELHDILGGFGGADPNENSIPEN